MKLLSLLKEVKVQKRTLDSIPKPVQDFVSNWVIGQYEHAKLTPAVEKWFVQNGYQLSKPTVLYRGVPGEVYERGAKSQTQSWTTSLSAADFFARDESSGPYAGKPAIGIVYQANVSPEQSVVDVSKFVKSIDTEAQYYLGVDGYETEREVLTKYIPQNQVSVKKRVRTSN